MCDKRQEIIECAEAYFGRKVQDIRRVYYTYQVWYQSEVRQGNFWPLAPEGSYDPNRAFYGQVSGFSEPIVNKTLWMFMIGKESSDGTVGNAEGHLSFGSQVEQGFSYAGDVQYKDLMFYALTYDQGANQATYDLLATNCVLHFNGWEIIFER